MIRFIGIDPGDVWCGYAMLEYDPTSDLRNGTQYFLTEARVFHIPSRPRLIDTVHHVLFGMPAIVVAENYTVRPVAYNRFSAGHTLRLLGALELGVQQNVISSWNTVPPGPWEKDLPKLASGMFKRWSPDWLRPSAKNWGHAKSAWRVLLSYLMREHPDVLNVLRDKDCVRTYRRIPSVLYSAKKRTTPHDLAAPAAKWDIPARSLRSLTYLHTTSRENL
jgi:hypothetical protein